MRTGAPLAKGSSPCSNSSILAGAPTATTPMNIPPFEVVLVSRCQDPAATAQYFSTMLWMAMTHAAASGLQGSHLQDMYGITTIPALVLLDGAGTVLCRNGHDRLQEDPTGCGLPWQEQLSSPCLRQVGFALLEDPRPVAVIGYAPVPRPPGRPLSFAPIEPSSARDPQYTEEAAIAHGGQESSRRHRVQTKTDRVAPSGNGTVGELSSRMPSGRATKALRKPSSTMNPQILKEATIAHEDHGSSHHQQGPGTATACPQPTSTLRPQKTPSVLSKRDRASSGDSPQPRPPPKPNLVQQFSPSLPSYAIQALAISVVSDQTLTLVPPWLSQVRSMVPEVEARSGASLAEIQRLRDSAWQAVGTATVDGTKRDCY